MGNRRRGSIQFIGSIGAPADDAMTLNTEFAVATANNFAHPNAYHPTFKAVSTMATNGETWVAGRNYTIVAAYASCHANSTDTHSNYTLYINGVAAAVVLSIPNGTKLGSVTGLAVSLSAGDELCWFYDALGTGGEGSTSISLQLSPR